MCEPAAATASPVPLGSSWTATTTPSGSRSSSRRFGLSTTTTFPAPASSAAATGHRISGRPQSGCRTFGSAERMRVPSPAAMMTTVGADTARIVVSALGARSSPCGESSNGRTLGFGPRDQGSNPCSPVRAAVRVRPRRMRTYVRAALHRSTNCGRSSRSVDVADARCCGTSACGPRAATSGMLRRWLDDVGHLDRPLRRHARPPPRRASRSRSRTMLVERSTYQPRRSSSGASTTRASSSARASCAGRARSGAGGGWR